MDGSGVQELAAVQQALEWFDHDVDGTCLPRPARCCFSTTEDSLSPLNNVVKALFT